MTGHVEVQQISIRTFDVLCPTVGGKPLSA